MLAVGILVPLEHGRMGRSWRYAEKLKELARYTFSSRAEQHKLILNRAQVDDPGNTIALDEYWERHQARPDEHSARSEDDIAGQDSSHDPDGYTKSRKMSTATTFVASTHALTPHHPALNLIESIKVFGPLIFPLYRLALLRKRVLIITDTPIEFACNLGNDVAPLRNSIH